MAPGAQLSGLMPLLVLAPLKQSGGSRRQGTKNRCRRMMQVCRGCKGAGGRWSSMMQVYRGCQGACRMMQVQTGEAQE